MPEPRITLVVVPRERFSFVERSLASIYEHTTLPFNLVYVTAGAPAPVRRFLEDEAKKKQFEVVHSDHYLSPNQARNLALAKVHTEYVAFLDNDALVTKGWLEGLLNCAEETGAWIVGPLYMIGEFKRATIHMAGGRLHVEEKNGRRILLDEQYLYDTPISQANMRLKRRACEYVEFHCMLVRTEVFDRLGPMDEKLLNLHEERDICLSAVREGGSVYIEPRSVVTYVAPPPCQWWDLPYFMMRWSEKWSELSARHFNQKWDIEGVRHISDTDSSHEEGSVVSFARAWRSRVAGMRVEAGGKDGDPKLPLEHAQLMIALLISVDREYFDLEVTAADGTVVESAKMLAPPDMIERLPGLLEAQAGQDLDIKIRPVRRDRPDEPILIRLEDLSGEDVDRNAHLSFMVLETTPDRYECWLAVNPRNWTQASNAAQWQPAADALEPPSHLVRLAGTTSAGSGETSHRVRLMQGVVGHLVTDKQLKTNEVDSYLSAGQLV